MCTKYICCILPKYIELYNVSLDTLIRDKLKTYQTLSDIDKVFFLLSYRTLFLESHLMLK